MPNRQCNLECVKDNEEEEVVEFIGPVKIILVDQKKQTYRCKVYNAAIIVLAQMAMAATTLIVIFYTLTYTKKTYTKALHIFLCTLGTLLPAGVLTMNSLNGAAAPMTLTDRKFEHGIVQIFGLGISIGGSVVSAFAKYSKLLTPHSIFGIAAVCFGIFSVIVGISMFIFCKIASDQNIRSFKHTFVIIHRVLGVFTITLSSACFILGIMKESFNEWLPLEEMFYCMVIFCVFYTCVIIYKPLHLSDIY